MSLKRKADLGTHCDAHRLVTASVKVPLAFYGETDSAKKTKVAIA